MADTDISSDYQSADENASILIQPNDSNAGGMDQTVNSLNSVHNVHPVLERSPKTYLMIYAFSLVHAVVTRGPITLISLYARDDLGLTTHDAVLAVVWFSIGRAMAVGVSSKWKTRSNIIACCLAQIVGTAMLYSTSISSFSFSRDMYIFPLSVVMMGFAEIIAGLDTVLKGLPIKFVFK